MHMIEELEIRRTETEPAAVIHLTIPRREMQQAFPEAVHEILDALKAQGLAPAGPPFARHFRRDPDAFDFDLGFPIDGDVAPQGRVKPGTLPAAKVVRTIYQGPYEGLPDAWHVFVERIRAEGHRVGEEFRERYVRGPEAGPDPAAWRTELSWRLAD